MLRVKIEGGGTHAGWRHPKAKREPWTCKCGEKLAAHWARCPECKEPRP